MKEGTATYYQPDGSIVVRKVHDFEVKNEEVIKKAEEAKNNEAVGKTNEKQDEEPNNNKLKT